MSDRIRNVILTVLAAVLLAGFAFAVPSAAIREEAAERYMQNVDAEDEYAFLFDD